MFYAVSSPFNFVPMLGMTPGEAHKVYTSSTIERIIMAAAVEQKYQEEDAIAL